MRMLTCKDFGLECENPMMYCLCLCPYCGENKKNCRCNQNFKSKQKNFFREKILNTDSMDKIKNTSMENHIDKSWWRLEKWQIGRSKFS